MLIERPGERSVVQYALSEPGRGGQEAQSTGGGDGGQREKTGGYELIPERQGHSEERDRTPERLRYYHR